MGARHKTLTPLEQAVKDVHRAFRRVPKPTELKNRMDFLKKREEKRLLGRDRSELTAHDLCYYVDDLCGRFDHRELAYFIPRFCEVLANGECTYPPLGWVCCLCCLEYSDFPAAWPDDQAQAIQHFVEALLITYVNEPVRFPNVRDIGELLCMAGKGGIEVNGMTAALAQADEQPLARALALWIARECFVPGSHEADQVVDWRGELADAFWIGKDFTKPVLDWLVSLEPWYLFSAATGREADPAWRQVLSEAAGLCDRWPERHRGIPRA